jgi:hypothetical protein
VDKVTPKGPQRLAHEAKPHAAFAAQGAAEPVPRKSAQVDGVSAEKNAEKAKARPQETVLHPKKQ